MSLQWFPGYLNQDRQEQTVRQIVICRPLVSLGSFPPVRTDKQNALGYGQVDPVALETDWVIRAQGQDRAGAWAGSLSILPCPVSRPQAFFLPLAAQLVASKGNIHGEESRTKGSKGTLGRGDAAFHEKAAETRDRIFEGAGTTAGARKELCVVVAERHRSQRKPKRGPD